MEQNPEHSDSSDTEDNFREDENKPRGTEYFQNVFGSIHVVVQ